MYTLGEFRGQYMQLGVPGTVYAITPVPVTTSSLDGMDNRGQSKIKSIATRTSSSLDGMQWNPGQCLV